MREIQNVYRAQGVTINDKHIEIIVSPDAAEGAGRRRRATPTSCQGQVVDKYDFRIENEAIGATDPQAGDRRVRCWTGSPRRPLQSESFRPSAASFQGPPRARRRRHRRQARLPRGPQGERHPRPLRCSRAPPSPRPHRTRVKKNIDFGEIGGAGGAVTFGGAASDDAMEPCSPGRPRAGRPPLAGRPSARAPTTTTARTVEAPPPTPGRAAPRRATPPGSLPRPAPPPPGEGRFPALRPARS